MQHKTWFHSPAATVPGLTRRRLLAAVPLALLAGCGGGGDDGPAPPPLAAARLVYTDGTRVAVYDLGTETESSFTPVPEAYTGGAGISAGGRVSVWEKPDTYHYAADIYDVHGRRQAQYAFMLELAYPLSPGFLSSDGARLLWSSNEPLTVFSPRTDRVWNVDLARYTTDRDAWQSFDGFADPVWVGSGRDIAMRKVADGSLWLQPAGQAVAGVSLQPQVGSYAFSADGTLLAWVQDGGIRMLDRASGTQWLALQDGRGGSFESVAFSPDGRMLLAVVRRGAAQVLVRAAWQRSATGTTSDGSALPGVSFTSFVGRISTAA